MSPKMSSCAETRFNPAEHDDRVLRLLGIFLKKFLTKTQTYPYNPSLVQAQ